MGNNTSKAVGVSGHENPAFQALALEIGGVTIASATIDKILLILATSMRDQPRSRRREQIADLQADLAEATKDSPAYGAAAKAWVTKAANLLSRRDRMVHVLWQDDPDDITGMFGLHIDSGEHVTLGRARQLVDDLRGHVGHPTLVMLAEVSGRAVTNRRYGMPLSYRHPALPG